MVTLQVTQTSAIGLEETLSSPYLTLCWLLPDWAFFPLYPAAMKAVSLPFMPFSANNEVGTQNAVELAGFIVSNVAFFISVFFFYKLTNKIFSPKRIALVATAFYCFWGGAVFYSAIYSEALFMALA